MSPPLRLLALAMGFASLASCLDDGSDLCRLGASSCDGRCVEVATDPRHCGACGVVCGGDEQCVDGMCQLPCGDLSACSDGCADFSSDARHCGDCETRCGKSEICSAGVCAPGCAGDSVACAGTCVDAASDEAHCGDCTTSCAADEACSDAQCTCFDTFADDANCGRCGNVCGTAQHCFEGTCRPLCVGEPCGAGTLLAGLRVGEDGALAATSQRDQAAVAAAFAPDGTAWVAFEVRGDNYLFDDRVSAATNGDVLLARLDPNLRVIERRLLSGAGNDRVRGMARMADGGLALVGSFSGDGSGFCGLPVAVGLDGFVVRLESDGSCRWSVALSGSGTDELNTVVVSSGGDVVVSGWGSPLSSLVPSMGSVVSLAGQGSDDAVVFAVSDAGALAWQRVIGGPLRDRGYGLAADRSGGVAVTGEYRGAVVVDAVSLPASAQNQDAAMVVKLDASNGDVVWGTGFPITSTSVGHNAQGVALAASADDHVWLLGDFVGAIDLGAGNTVSSFLTSRDLLLVELAPDGSTVRHERIGNEDIEEAAALAVREDGSLIVSGSFRQTLDFGGTVLSSVAGRDVFVGAVKPDGDGLSYLWAKSFGGGDDDRARSIAVHQSVLLVVGSFESDLDLGRGPMWSPWGDTKGTPEPRDDGFVAVLSL